MFVPIKSYNMQTILYKSDSRGIVDHGWLKAKHSFSFANYYNPNRVNFGVLRVLNDDTIAPAMGFGKHPHDNMEIITIPLKGELEHQDSMGNASVIKSGEVQVMSAGTGVFHSEYNHSHTDELNLFQIWLFPNKLNVQPRYDQKNISELKEENAFFQILSPNSNDKGVWIHQNAYFYLGEFTDISQTKYTLNDSQNGVYLMVIDGEIDVNNQSLETRDAIGIWDTDSLNINIKKESKLLLMEVPMENHIEQNVS